MNVQQSLNRGTYAQEGGERKAWSYYASFAPAANTTEVILFQTGLGGGSNIALYQTNFPTNGSIPNSQKFEISGIAPEYVGAAAKADADIIAIRKWLATSVLQIGIQDKAPSLQVKLSRLMGLSLGLFNDPTTTAEPVAFTSRENTSPIYRLSQKITLAANTPFTVKIIPGVAAGANQTSDIVSVDLIGELITLV